VSDWGVGVFSSEVRTRGVRGTRQKPDNDSSKCQTSGVLKTQAIRSVVRVQTLGRESVALSHNTLLSVQESQQTVLSSQFKLQKVRAGSPPQWGARTGPMSQVQFPPPPL
ncbi:hypothetical protein FOL46_003043, partial [Perkinsus olseni]